MTKKYFYTNALAAAWMAQQFDMKFKSARGQNLYFDGGNDFRGEKDGGVYGGEYYYVHPDSLHLLDIKNEDLYEKLEKFHDGESAINHYYALLDRAKEESETIIQRKGKAFHWPESEEV